MHEKSTGAEIPKIEDKKPISVLVLDDEDALRDIVKQTLVRAGCDVTTAAEGGEGLQALLSKRFDVVVSDLKMEPMDGITFLTEALRIWPWMGVVVLSGFIENDVREKAAKLGIKTILKKPISFVELANKVIEESERMQARIKGDGSVTLDHTQYELSLLQETTKSAMEANSLPQALRALSSTIGNMLPSLAAGILSIETVSANSMLVLSLRKPVTEDFTKQMEHDIKEGFTLLSSTKIHSKLNVEIQGVKTEETGVEKPTGLFSVPIISGNTISGMLTLVPPPNYTYSESDMSFLYHAANHVTTVLTAFQRIRELAVRDELTGLYNRHHLQNELTTAWEMANRYGFSTGILILDIDHFKTINDTYGHLAGDEVLRELADITNNVCRNSDIIARYGGDEIVIVLPDADQTNLSTLSERLLIAVRENEFCHGVHKLQCTISVGGASSRTEDGAMLSPEDVLGQADNALYMSKRSGRDHSTIFNQDVSENSPSPTSNGEYSDVDISEVSKAIPTVAVVDDDTSILNIMELLLEMEGCKPAVFSTAGETRDYVAENQGELDVAFVDLNLDDESGLDLIHELHNSDDAMVVIVITGDATLDNAINSMRHGAYDFVQKPIQREQLKMTLSRSLEYRKLRIENKEYQFHLEDMVRRKSRELTTALQRTRDSFAFTLRALTTLLDAKEEATGQHSQRVQDITELLAKKNGITGKELEDMRQGALLHDIGKIGIPDRILLKPGPLTDEEWKIMRTHAQIGYDIIKTSPDLKDAAEIVGKHHEKWDGTGYPNGLKGEDIPIGARIFTLADAYDAMRSNRPYRKGMSVEDALIEIDKHSGTQFDPRLVEFFSELVNEIEEIGKWTDDNETKT